MNRIRVPGSALLDIVNNEKDYPSQGQRGSIAGDDSFNSFIADLPLVNVERLIRSKPN